MPPQPFGSEKSESCHEVGRVYVGWIGTPDALGASCPRSGLEKGGRKEGGVIVCNWFLS